MGTISGCQEALAKNAGRVIDLFRQWDTDGDGVITKKEFREAMPKMGYEGDLSELDKLFASWDDDGSGEIDFNELKTVGQGRLLLLHPPCPTPPSPAPPTPARTHTGRVHADRLPP